MSTILIVEDHALSRQALKMLLEYMGHRVLAATDGTEALALAREETPALVITDVVMPNMDGFEVVRLLRTLKGLEELPVIFYTATYRLSKAQRLVSEGYGNSRVISKPADPPMLANAVNEMLGLPLYNPPEDSHATDLSKSNSLQGTGLKLPMFLELSYHMVSERDPMCLVDIFCRATRDILKCHHSLIALPDDTGKTRYIIGNGRCEQSDVCPVESLPLAEIQERVLTQRLVLRKQQSLAGTDREFRYNSFPVNRLTTGGEKYQTPDTIRQGIPYFESWMIIPFATPNHIYGWFCLADKFNYLPFSDADEEIMTSLATQAAVAYENILLLDRLQRRADELCESEKSLKISLKDKELLLKELYHRTKNNMQVISSLLNLQAMASGDERVMRMSKEMQSRIRAMALVHEKLYKSSNLSTLDMKEYIEDLAESMVGGYVSAQNITLGLDIQSVDFPIDMANACGLILNELISNSLKHAFPKDRHGIIDIGLHLNADGQIELRYEDDGIGMPEGFDIAKSNSLGLQLVHSLATRQLEGTVRIASEKGTQFLISFRKLGGGGRKV